MTQSSLHVRKTPSLANRFIHAGCSQIAKIRKLLVLAIPEVRKSQELQTIGFIHFGTSQIAIVATRWSYRLRMFANRKPMTLFIPEFCRLQ